MKSPIYNKMYISAFSFISYLNFNTLGLVGGVEPPTMQRMAMSNLPVLILPCPTSLVRNLDFFLFSNFFSGT